MQQPEISIHPLIGRLRSNYLNTGFAVNHDGACYTENAGFFSGSRTAQFSSPAIRQWDASYESIQPYS